MFNICFRFQVIALVCGLLLKFNIIIYVYVTILAFNVTEIYFLM
jgi:hypothetical protein